MSKFLWKGLLVSPAVLAASLVVSSRALAAEQPVEIAATDQAHQLHLAGAATEVAKSETAAVAIEPASLASNLTVDTIEKESANLYKGFVNDPIAPVAEQAKAPENPVAADLSETKPAVAPANLSVEQPVAEQIPAVAPANLSETQPAAPLANLNAEKSAAQPEQISQSTHPSAQPPAQSNVLEQIKEYSTEGSSSEDAAGQVTSVSQLSDVRPTDWAFQALQSLVERYGCIAGYPDGTFRGNRAMTRYEFAAGLNACLDKVTELIKSGTTNLATKEDLAELQRLQEEFAAELATLRGRVDALEARTSELEANQFSTTTKLSGEAIFSVADTTKNNRRETETALNYRLRLNLLTSFTGKDTLITGLQAYNIRSFGPNLGLSTGAFSGLSDSQAKLSFEPQFPGINPQTLSSIDANAVELYKLLYVFPVSNSITLFAGPKAETSDAFQAITPFAGEGQEAVSRLAAYNPVVRVSGGTSGSG